MAIIGAGVSGLSCAYFLFKQAEKLNRPMQIDIFERKHSYGGNADTVVVNLGQAIDATGHAQPYHRWADLGVNDVNLATYDKLAEIMIDIGYLDKERMDMKHMRPLQDTTSYFNVSGSLAIADDAEMRAGVSDPRFSLGNADDKLLAPLVKVVHQSALDRLPFVTPSYTVAHFFKECIARPEAMLSAAIKSLGIKIDLHDKALPKRLEKVRDEIYYPRIAAMYFTDDRGPGTMPLQSPFQYYQLQEGSKDKAIKPDRRYFAQGAQKWLEELAGWLQQKSSDLVTINIYRNADVRLHVTENQVTVKRPGVMNQSYPLCVLANHADDAKTMLTFAENMQAWHHQITDALARVRYTHTYAVCHTDARKLPQNTAIWRTYNVLQRSAGETSFPYRMTYVENLHQNDAFNPDYAGRPGLPMFLTSMVKSLDEIPESAMLDRVSSAHGIAPEMFQALPKATQRHLQGETMLGGYRSEQAAIPPHLAGKALTSFKHNVLDAHCIAAQELILKYNMQVAITIGQKKQPPCALLFGGGWTNGAGLQEQCIIQSEAIAGWILPGLRDTVSQEEAADPAACATTA